MEVEEGEGMSTMKPSIPEREEAEASERMMTGGRGEGESMVRHLTGTGSERRALKKRREDER